MCVSMRRVGRYHQGMCDWNRIVACVVIVTQNLWRKHVNDSRMWLTKIVCVRTISSDKISFKMTEYFDFIEAENWDR